MKTINHFQKLIKHVWLLIFLFVHAISYAQITVTIKATGTAGSYNTGSVSAGGIKNDGNMSTITTSSNRGWAKFDLSSIPAGSIVTAVTCNFTTYSSTISSATNYLYGFVADPFSMTGTTLYTTCGSGTVLNSSSWTADILNSRSFTSAGLTYIQNNLVSNLCVGFVRGSSNTYNIYGYPAPTADQPSLVITYTPITPCSGTPSAGTAQSTVSTVCDGVNFTLSLSGATTGEAGLTYQWQSAPDDIAYSNIVGATGTSYVTSQTSSKYYRCRINCSNSGLFAYSASVNVLRSPSPAVITAGGPLSFCSGGSVLLTASAGTGYIWSNGSTSQSITTSSSGTYIVTVTSGACSSVSAPVTVTNSGPVFTALASPSSVCLGGSSQLDASTILQDKFDPINTSQWTIVAGTASSICGSVTGNALYFDGSGNREVSTGNLNVAAGGTINFYLKVATGSAPCEMVDSGDEILLQYSTNNGSTWNTLNTYLSGYSTFTSVAVPIPAGAQTISTRFKWAQPSNSGSGFDNWAIDNINIMSNSGGATYSWSPTVGLSNANIANPIATVTATTTYTVSVTNGSCSGTGSVVVNLTTPTPASITASGSLTICSGYSVGLTANAGLSYNWSTGATTQGITVSSAGNYTVTVNYGGGCISASSPSTVTVNPATNISANPFSSSIVSGTNASFSVTASGTGLTYQWQVDNGFGYSNLSNTGVYSNVTTATLNITGATLSMNGYYYRCVISSGCPIVNSSGALLTVIAPCSGTPLAGTTVSTANPVCSGTNFTLSLSGATTGVAGLTYQWQSSPDNISPYVNISGATSATYLASQTTAKYYRCIVTCSYSVASSISNPLNVSIGGFINCYCASGASSTNDEEIFNVTIGTLNKSSSCGTTGGPGSVLNQYSNYTSTVTAPNLSRGISYPFSVQVGSCGGSYSNAVKIYIDYNQNGLFTDAGENVYTSASSTTGSHFESGNIIIPVSAIIGSTVMRVVNVETSSPTSITSCGTYTWGETEDYLVNIVPSATIVVNPVSTSQCQGASVNVSFGVTSAFNLGNVFTAELSDASGSFASPTNIGTLTSTTSGTINATIPLGTTDGSGYRIRVTASNPVSTGTDNGSNIIIGAPVVPGTIAGSAAICANSTNTYTVASVPGAISYTWTLPSGWSGSSTSNSIVATATTNGGSITVRANNGCGTSGVQALSVVINSGALPAQPGAITGATSVCASTARSYSVASVAGAISYTWTLPSGWSGSSTSTSIVATTGTVGGVVTVKANSTCGSSPIQILSVDVSAGIPAQPGTITGSTSVCGGSVNIYSVAAVSGATSYIWTLPSGWAGTSSTNSITVTAGTISGSITVKSSNGCGSSTAQTLSVSASSGSIPTQPVAITGLALICSGSVNTYSVAAVAGATSYTWTLPSGWTGSSTTASISATASSSGGNITVKANNSCGSSSVQTQSITVSTSIPPLPGSISGSTSICGGSTNVYSIVPVSGALSYTWTMPSGWTGTSTSNSISATSSLISGNITVVANNGCGSSSAQILAITVTGGTAPAQPGSVSGTTAACSGSIYTYSVASVAGATSYTWTLPSGWSGTSSTNSIVSTAGSANGDVTVKANNACGSSSVKILSVTSSTVIPATPGLISGNPTTCPGTVNIYTVAAVAGATSYTWTLPSGWSGISTSNSITATAGSSSGTISVKANSGCGSSSASSIIITVTSGTAPVQPGAITGATEVCSGTARSYSVTPVAGALSYTWTLPSGWSGSSTTNSIIATVNANSGDVTVRTNNSCGSSPAQTLSVVSSIGIPAQPGAISGSNSVCPGTDNVYSVSAVAGASSYAWTLPSGWSGTFTTNTINVTSGTESGNITVRAANGCGTSTAQALAVNVTSVNLSVTQNAAVLTADASAALYQWIDCNTNAAIGGATNQSYTATVIGSYAVIVTENGCSDTSDCMTVNAVTGISSTANTGNLLIYPNPSLTGIFTVSLGEKFRNPVEIKVSDISGREIYSGKIMNENSQLDLSKLNKGVYFIKLEDSRIQKLIIQ